MKKIVLLYTILLLFSCKQEEVVAQLPEVPEVRELVHPSFDITLEELQETLVAQSSWTMEAVSHRPQVFLDMIAQSLDTLSEEVWVLVDKQHSLPFDHVPELIVELDNYPMLVRRKADMQLSGFALPSLLAMSEAARQEGVELMVSSTYRSYNYQEYTYNWCVDHYGQEEADRVSAQPGKSQHQLGHAVDFGSISEEFEFTDAGQWMINNGWKYGWSMSYPQGAEEITGYKYEVWHYRYITPLGTAMQREFFEDMQQYFLVYWNDYRNFYEERRL